MRLLKFALTWTSDGCPLVSINPGWRTGAAKDAIGLDEAFSFPSTERSWFGWGVFVFFNRTLWCLRFLTVTFLSLLRAVFLVCPLLLLFICCSSLSLLLYLHQIHNPLGLFVRRPSDFAKETSNISPRASPFFSSSGLLKSEMTIYLVSYEFARNHLIIADGYRICTRAPISIILFLKCPLECLLCLTS